MFNAILVTKVFGYRYSTINIFVKKQYFSTKFGNRFSNLLLIKYVKFYSNSFIFDISIVQCLGVYFFLDTVHFIIILLCRTRWLIVACVKW